MSTHALHHQPVVVVFPDLLLRVGKTLEFDVRNLINKLDEFTLDFSVAHLDEFGEQCGVFLLLVW